jgi:hypothetical protein
MTVFCWRASKRDPDSAREQIGRAVERMSDRSKRRPVNLNTIEYLARCHCGALTARYRTAIEPSAWSLRACQCSFCRSHGALMTSDPAGVLEFRSSDPEQVQRYRFGGRTADFLICRQCGVYIGVQMASDQGRFGVLNVLSLRPPVTSLLLPAPMAYGAETAEVRTLRREARWTPVAADSI